MPLIGHLILLVLASTKSFAAYTCLNDEPPIADNALSALQTCANQTWEPWPCFYDQTLVVLPSLPEDLGLPNPMEGPVAASVYLLGVRERLIAQSFAGAYDSNNFPEEEDITCDYNVREQRGRCNTEGAEIMEGAAGTAFARNSPRVPQEETLLVPNPHDVSHSLFTRNGEYKSQDLINVLSVGWIQFMLHDWFNHEVDDDADPLRCPLGFSDSAIEDAGIDAFEVYPTKIAEGTDGEFINTETHWWDASQLYGKKKLSRNLREKAEKGRQGFGNRWKCELALAEDGNLPILNQGQEKVGFDSNYWSGIAAFHHLFLKEHNYVCEQLRTNYPDLNNDERFHKARLIISAQLAKLHTLEWTTAILDNPQLKLSMNLAWYGSSALGFDAIDVPALKGSPRAPTPDPFAMTEEFVSVYRMHSLLPDYYELRRTSNPAGVEQSVPLRDILGADVTLLNQEYSQEDLILSYGVQKAGAIALNNYPRDLQYFLNPGVTTDQEVTDLAVVELLRDRERGLPRYNEFRRGLGLKPISSFEDLTSSDEEVQLLKETYADVEEIDLMVGLHAEECRPQGFVFTESAFQVFILMATKRLAADGFFTDKWTPEIYTPFGLQHVESSTLKSTILRHYPGLANDDTAIPDNAFAPWTVLENV